MNPIQEFALQQTRRQFFAGAGLSLGTLALATMPGGLRAATAGTRNYGSTVHPSLPELPHFAPKAKRIIYLHMNGAPSQLDLWDYKPRLVEHFNVELPASIRMGQRLTTMTSGQKGFPVAPSKFKFAQHGHSGTWVSELLPHTAKNTDDIALIRSVHTHAINHDPACTFLMTGTEVPGKPGLGSWLSYGLGSVNADLPSFVVLTPFVANPSQALFTRMWSSGFLSSKHSGVVLRDKGDPVLYIKNPPGVDSATRREMLDGLNQLNELNHQRLGDPETQARIAQYEMAFRMQTSVPDLADISKESKATLEMYGPEVTTPGSYAYCALLARRMAERGVRMVQINHRGWDQHGNLPTDITRQCKATDQPVHALLEDLKRLGLLQDTLVVWGGEFGRTVYSQGTLTKENYGRDHHPRNYCMWLAGGGIKGGTVYGETDDFSYNIAKDPVHLNDLNATLLHCMGIDHSQFTFKFQGLAQRLTGVENHSPIKALLA
ncbi:MAG: DUF1501 domain-containing protein [Pedosphaera sp.]|nr:DUF1501 domain-containing protein [Pedosphaera sp.]